MSQNPWVFLRGGNMQEGLALCRERYSLAPTPSHIMELGVAYLWAQDYQAAFNHFDDVVRQYPRSLGIFYGMAGVAKWCLDEANRAVEQWRAGLDAQYNEGAGGVSLPVLLFAASVLKPGVFSRKEAEDLLKEKLNGPWATNWPGPLAKLTLDLVGEQALEQLAFWRGSIPPQRKWLIIFYNLISELGREKLDERGFRVAMRDLVDASRPEWSEQNDFQHLVWNPEFFIARHEGART